MSGLSAIKKTLRKAGGRRPLRLLTVEKVAYLTPNMIRVTFAGSALNEFPEDREGGNCKLFLPEPDEKLSHFSARLVDGPEPVRRTYTVRYFRKEPLELDIDFVAHGDNGPASRWAIRAKPGSFLGFAGPSEPKLTQFKADWYLFAADSSAIPMAAATLESMPDDAKGVAVFEINTAEDRQHLIVPDGIECHWLIHPNPQQASLQQEEFIRSINWPEGHIQTCIAGESGLIRSLRGFLKNERQLPAENMYISGYWKIGMIEDEHQEFKRAGG